MKRYHIEMIGFLLLAFTMSGQDMHFSQYYENPSLLNPALTGALNPMRASVTNRQQWRSVTAAYKTYGASFETRFKPSHWEQVDKFRTMTFKERSMGRLAAGLSVYTDKAGDGNFGQTHVNLSLASFVPVGKFAFVSMGLQASRVQRRLDDSKLVFPSQYNGLGYDPNLASRENFSSLNYSYNDLAAGILWSFSEDDKRSGMNKQLKANMGFSAYHLVRPRLNFLSDESRVNMKYVLHGDFLISVERSFWAVAPSYLVQMQGSSVEFIFGSMFRYVMNNDSKYTGLIKRNSISYGLFYRSKDAIIVSTQLEWQEQYALVMSYDINVSQLANASSARGGFELTLRYTPPGAYLYQKKPDAPKSGKE